MAARLQIAALAVVLASFSWVVSDRVEQQNDFCNACHLPDGVPLHLETRENFDRVSPINLAGVHGRGWIEEREDSAFRCIDCHSGSGVFERTRVKLLAARDGVRWAIGDFEEPDGMPFDLSAQTCQGCHASFRRSAAPGWTLEAYHGREEHDSPQAPACVRCHAVHQEDGDGMAYFMNRPRVDRVCRKCHEPGTPTSVPSLVWTSLHDQSLHGPSTGGDKIWSAHANISRVHADASRAARLADRKASPRDIR